MLRSIKGRRGGKKNRLGDALRLNIWPVDKHFQWLVRSVSLQVLGEGDSSIVGGVERARLQESFSSAILLENPTWAQGQGKKKNGNLYKLASLRCKQASKGRHQVGAASQPSCHAPKALLQTFDMGLLLHTSDGGCAAPNPERVLLSD